MVVGYLQQQFLLLPVGAILLTAVVAHIFNRLSLKNIRKYENKRLAVTEALGRIYGHLLKIISSFERSEQEYWIYQVADLTAETWMTWSDIRHSHRFFLIPKDLRSEMEKFFSEYEAYREVSIICEIMAVTNKVCERWYGKKLRDQPSFLFEARDGGTIQASYWGLVFWKVRSTLQMHGKLKKVQLPWVTPAGSQVEDTIRDEEVEPFEVKFLQEVWEESDKNPVISKARKDHEELHSEAERLKGKLEKEISEWAS